MSEWIWRVSLHGVSAVCRDCGASLTGADDAVRRLQLAHDPAVCAVRAKTPAARRLRGAR